MLNARTRGVELGATVQLTDHWRVHGAYTYLHKVLRLDAGSRDLTRGTSEANDPSFLASLRSHMDLRHGVMLDAFFRHVGRRPTPVVPAYSELDLRVAWAPRGGWEVSLNGQNLLHARHPEFGIPGPLRVEFERGVVARSTWRF
jgi:iron complex outermembrane receptor protein